MGEWGESCGPRPAPRGAGGGGVTVSESGGELVFSGGGYPRTSGCFEMGGGINVTSHSASPRGWRTTCATGAGDPRRATIITTVTASDRLISFDETGQYQFIIQGQNCTASVRRNRSYTLVKRLGEETPPPAASSAPPPATTSAPAPTPTPTVETPRPDDRPPSSSCAQPGEPARIEVKPARKVLKPGESFALRALVFDGAGCRLTTPPVWSTTPGKVTVSATGMVAVAADAPEGEVAVLAGLNGKAARVTIDVVSPERYAQLLASGAATRGEDDVAVAVLATGSMGASAAVAQDGSARRRLIFGGVLGAVVLALLAAGGVMWRRTRPEVEAIEEEVEPEVSSRVVRKKRVIVRASASSALHCPLCKRGFSAGPTFCPEDGTRLVPNPDWKGPATPS